MKRGFIAVMLLSACLLISGLAHAYDFSADMVMTAEGQKMSGRIFSKGDRFRMEMNAQGQQMIMITRMDKKVAWSVMPDQKMYMEMPIDPKSSPKTEIKGEMERKQLGTETVNGHPTKKYLVTYKEGTQTLQAYQWMATDINFPVKTADLNNKWVQEYKNIKMSAQSDNLFEIPAGYKKMQMPAMPGGMNAR
jgi:outer membrane lipoprotein-sorting protein